MMDIPDGIIWITLIILVILVGFSVVNIFHFIPVETKCEPSFKVINQCGCVPDAQLANLFAIKNYVPPVKLGNFTK